MTRRGLIYAALFVGAVIFAWPFFWMASTSAKLDRELFDGTTAFSRNVQSLVSNRRTWMIDCSPASTVPAWAKCWR
jgi:ABC-type glycerol-3-phosphate transport system permease component